MISAIYIGPRSVIPDWIIDMERDHFGIAWSLMDENEHIWAIPFIGFARWRVIPGIQEAELLRIVVAGASCQKGYGRAILQYSQNQVINFGIDTLLLEVRVSNVIARSLYESEGWSYLGLRKQYYGDSEDAASYKRVVV